MFHYLIKGAVIASDATPDKNKLSTDTLTYSDIQNKAEYDSSSIGVNVNTTKDAKINEKGITPNIGVKASGDADSTTKSAISPGTIEVRSNPNQDLSTLSRDTANSLNALGKIFDKKTVKEQQELAGLFGELAFEEVHKISKSNGWDEGSPQKIALHALVGGIMSELAGSGFTAGAKGAGFNEAIQKELSKIKDPALHQWASYIIGSAAGGTVGGATAVSGTKNNLLAYYLTSTKDALRDALRAKNGEEPTDQQIAELNAKISDALNVVFQDGRPTIEGEAYVIRNVLQQNGIPSASIDDFVNVYTSQAPKAVEQYNKEQLKQGDVRTSALIETVAENIKGTIDLIYLMTPTGQKELVQALLQDPTLPATIGREAYNSLKNWAANMQGNNGDEDQAKAQGQLLGQVLTAYATAKGTNAFKKLGVAAEEIQFPEVIVTADRIPKKWTVDPATQAADIEAGVLKNGSYIKNPTAQNINDLIKDGYNYVGSKKMNGQYMYVVDSEGSIIIGNRAGQRMPHPTLIGGENPQVQAAGIVEIRGGKIYMVDNASGHFKPGAGSLEAAENAFSKLPSNIFSKNFQGYVPYTK